MATAPVTTGVPTRAPFMPVPPAAITRVLSRFDRDELAGFIAVAIDLLDVADGDTDLEDSDEDRCPGGDDAPIAHWGDDAAGDAIDAEDDDPGGCPLDNGEGEGHFGQGLLPMLPAYGLDQSEGPVNEREAVRAHQAQAMGLVRSPTGGWRHQT